MIAIRNTLTKIKPQRLFPFKEEISSMGFDIKHSDALAYLRSLPLKSVDLIVTDPPYESLEKYRKIGSTTRLKHSKSSSNDWFEIFPNSKFTELFEELSRVLKNNAHCYIFCDQETMHAMVPIGSKYMKYWKDLVWDKKVFGMGYHYRNQNERILFFEKGKRKLKDLGISDVLPYKRVFRGYPTEKPVSLLEILIYQSTEAGMVVLDPFMGSGSTGVAALRQKCKFKGCDLSKKAVDITYKQLKQEYDYPNTPFFGSAYKKKAFNEYMNLDNFFNVDIAGFSTAVHDVKSTLTKKDAVPEVLEKLTNLQETFESYIDKDDWFFSRCIEAYQENMVSIREELRKLVSILHERKFVVEEYSGEVFDKYSMYDFPYLDRFLSEDDFERILEG